MERIGAVVIGAGVVGLACARTLAQRGIDTVILEQHDTFGSETSARNSEVIHAGLYYPAGSLKVELCVTGRHLLYEFCINHVVSQLVVATSAAQESRLHVLLRQGENNGVDDLRLLVAADARALEPGIRCTAALLSPSTGIIDSHGLMLALPNATVRRWRCAAPCGPAHLPTMDWRSRSVARNLRWTKSECQLLV